MPSHSLFSCFFSFIYTATTEIYTLSLHDALPISFVVLWGYLWGFAPQNAGSSFGFSPLLLHSRALAVHLGIAVGFGDRKSTRLNSSHPSISYAVFCLKKKKNNHSNAF